MVVPETDRTQPRLCSLAQGVAVEVAARQLLPNWLLVLGALGRRFARRYSLPRCRRRPRLEGGQTRPPNEHARQQHEPQCELRLRHGYSLHSSLCKDPNPVRDRTNTRPCPPPPTPPPAPSPPPMPRKCEEIVP